MSVLKHISENRCHASANFLRMFALKTLLFYLARSANLPEGLYIFGTHSVIGSVGRFVSSTVLWW